MATWTARCKSGYTFAGKACNRPAPRGMLLCSDCLTAEALPASQEAASGLRIALAAIAAGILSILGVK